MEFSDVGRHCEMPLCHMQDFLPFKCDSCYKCFCLEHRMYDSHGCNGQARKDATSIDCPICNKSIKFFRSQNPDAVWEDHFLTGCSSSSSNFNNSSQNTQHISKSSDSNMTSSSSNKCGLLGCRIVLGLSNRFTCLKCRVDVCLSHRAPEDHSCSSVVPKQQPGSARISNKSTSNKSELKDSIRTSTSSSTTNLKPKLSPANEMAAARTSGPPTSNREVLKNDAFLSRLEIQNNYNSSKQGPGKSKKINSNKSATTRLPSAPNSNPPSGTNQSSESYRFQESSHEICPMCQMQFSDPVELVQHFEQSHADSNGTSTLSREHVNETNTTSASTSNTQRKSDCTIQ